MPRRKSKRRDQENFDSYVEHPRFGSRPHITGLNPEHTHGGEVFLHWHSPEEARIPNTAILANLERQSPATVPVTHYFDAKRTCRECGLPFIFFAREQVFWYEELGFPLESDCVRCSPCRKHQQGVASKRERYEELFHVAGRTVDESLEMVDCCLFLIEQSNFSNKQLSRIRSILKGAEPHLTSKHTSEFDALRARLARAEAADEN